MVQSGVVILTDIERTELARYEAVIEHGLGTFVEVGQALLAIRENKLYRASYGTFEEYCQDRWGFNSPHARRLMRAAETVSNIESQNDPMGSFLPISERQTRPLTVLEPERQREAWDRVIETAPEGRITTGHVQRVVNEMTGRTTQEPATMDEEPDIVSEASREPIADEPEFNGDSEINAVLETNQISDDESSQPSRLAVHFSSETPEHYTPQEIIEATLDCLGAITLDPCSNSHENPNVPAQNHFTIEDDGLAQEWHGTVYMNPPYGRGIIDWVQKLVDEHRHGRTTEAIALVPARTDTQWWQLLRDYPVCLVVGRLKFVNDGNGESAPFPSAIFYLGTNIDQFYYAFDHIGDIWQRVEPEMFAS